MNAATIDRTAAEDFSWRAHALVEEFDASAERDALFALFPETARRLEHQGLIERGAHGGVERAPRLAQVRIELADLLVATGDQLVPDGLSIPHVSADLMRALGATPRATREWEGNLLANAGINRMGGLAFGAGTGQIYNTANSAIGVGDTNTAAAATQTDLSAAVNAANRYVQVVDSQPTFSTQVLTMVATYATGNANFAWAEWAIGQNTASGANAITAAMLNRKVASLGTKTSAAAWAFTVTITIS